MIMVVLYDMSQVGSGVLRRLMAVGEDSRASAVAASRLHFTRPGPRASDGIGGIGCRSEWDADSETKV